MGMAYLSSGTLILLTKSSAFHSYAMQTCDVNHGTCMNEYLGSGCTDDDPTTYCEVLQGGDSNRTMTLWMNYTKPTGATRNSTWHVIAQNATWGIVKPAEFTIGIPAGSFAQQPLQFRYQDHSYMYKGHCNQAGTTYSCYNGTSWQSLNNHQIGLGRPAGDQCHEDREAYDRAPWCWRPDPGVRGQQSQPDVTVVADRQRSSSSHHREGPPR